MLLFTARKMKYQNPVCNIPSRIKDIGIPKDAINDIFNKFTQSSIIKTGASGAGLGLAIFNEIINAHQGKIWAESNQNGGVTFIFCIPYLKQ